MQLAFCIFKYFPFGGIQRDLMKMTREARARGHKVRIYAIRWEAPEPSGDIELKIVPVEAFANHSLYERFSDWVHDHLKTHPVDLLVGMNKMPGLDVYYAGDSCYEEKARTQRNAVYRKLPRYRHFARFERSVFDPLVKTQILTISDVQTPYFRRYYSTQPERFHPLPPGIEKDRVAPPDTAALRADFRGEFGLAEDDLLLLFIGSGFIKKGLDRVLVAFKALPAEIYAHAQLFVIGRDNVEPFKRMSIRLGVADRVRFFTDGRDDVPRFLFSGDGLLLPAYDENAGMVILEAMFAGLPALVTPNCGYAKYLKEARAGLQAPVPFDQQAFNSQVVELLTSDERTEWRARGKASAGNPGFFQLAEKAVDYLEAFAARKRPLIAFTLFKYFPYGGLQRDFLRIARRCVERGYVVRIYTLSWEDELPPDMDVIIVPVSSLTNHVRYKRFAAWVAEDLRWRPAVCLVGFNKMPGLDVYYAADSCFEEKAQQLRAPLYRRTARYKLFSRFEAAVFGPTQDTAIMLLTQDQKHTFRKHYGTRDSRMSLLPPGISQDRRRPADAAEIRRTFRDEFDIGQDELLLLLIGSGFITKGLDRALLAMAALPENLKSHVRLFVIGQDNPRQFLNLAAELKIENRVTIFAGRDDIPRFLQGADLLVHPAYMESGGIVLVEAVVAGLPVIATDVCGFAPYVAQANAGVLVQSPFDQARFNEQLCHMLNDADARRCWSDNGASFGVSADIYGMTDRACDVIEERIGG